MVDQEERMDSKQRWLMELAKHEKECWGQDWRKPERSWKRHRKTRWK